MPWIEHPAISNPVGLWRWLQFKVACWLMRIGSRLEDRALYPERCDVCGQRKPRYGECDHVPF